MANAAAPKPNAAAAPSIVTFGCSDCAYWRERTHLKGVKRVGVCHRFPPAAAGLGVRPGEFPMTREDDWCGEHSDLAPQAAVPATEPVGEAL
ncbi:MAG: hypothetical protein ACREEW_01365 [Caulobacteraceae bacterium]